VAAGVQQEKGKENDYVMVAASYDLGAVSVSGGYNVRNGNAASGDDNEFTVGVNVPLGAFNVSAGYAAGKTERAGATVAKASGFGLGATYALSKRTRLYGGFRSNQVKNGAGVKTADARLFALGVRHDF
jgi:predicted porin